ncbi:hypothetical protein AO385_0773 [Moraxella catarrhalis]|uniref:Uncharacterized protein n=1 Tax=Moraxella catarrhalis TaxID=480 RepID=A0A198UM23_MORCA|nr:hypothetical protein AO384_0579 [Moraxella catarrhalis]OAU98837.1 hypothetical protein AO383_0403 [Moraxella catarrhalis]OAV02928.1 hypothetical protein AO385_0773 [Moraxella catarrhalis]
MHSSRKRFLLYAKNRQKPMKIMAMATNIQDTTNPTRISF